MKSREWIIERTPKRPGEYELTSQGLVPVTVRSGHKAKLRLVEQAA